MAYVLYSAGVVAVLAGFVQSFLSSIGPLTRFILAALFVLGTGLMLIAMDALTQDFILDLYVVFLAVFWLLSRMSLSHQS